VAYYFHRVENISGGVFSDDYDRQVKKFKKAKKVYQRLLKYYERGFEF
jgi:hypothetical protein